MPFNVSSANRIDISYAEESTFQTEPDPLNTQSINITTTTGLQPNPTFVNSATIRSDRQTLPPIKTQVAASGSVTQELQYYTANPELFEAAFFNTTSAATGGPTSASDLTFNASAKTITTAGAVDWTDYDLSKGSYIKITGGTTQTSEYFKVSETTSPTSTVLTVHSSTPVVNESPGTVFIVEPLAILTNGTDFRTFTFVQGHLDRNRFFVVNGAGVNSAALSFSQGAIPTIVYEIIGTTARLEETDPRHPGSSDPSALPIINPTDNFKQLSFTLNDGTLKAATIVSNLSINLNNNITPIYGLGSPYARDLVEGNAGVSGTATMYFEDIDVYNDIFLGRAFSFGIVYEDLNGNVQVWDIPNVTGTGIPFGNITQNGAVTLETPWTASVDPELGYTVAVHTLSA